MNAEISSGAALMGESGVRESLMMKRLVSVPDSLFSVPRSNHLDGGDRHDVVEKFFSNPTVWSNLNPGI